jgi:uncharacterized RDD family membrane protein YckC
MTCPSCRVHVAAGAARCGACGAILAVPTEGALAPDLSSRSFPMRELPGTRKPQRTWKDEVRERVHSRRQSRTSGSPLDEDDLAPEEAAIEQGLPEGALVELGDGRPDPSPYAVTEKRSKAVEVDPPVQELLDLPLGPPPAVIEDQAPPVVTEPRPDPAPAPARARARATTVAHEDLATAAEMPVSPAPRAQADAPAAPSSHEYSLDESGPLPTFGEAAVGERMMAAAIDLAIWTASSVLVVYFASRVAHVKIAGLLVAWPWVAAFLAFLGIAYATWFTGTTGQTIGKIATGLRVVDVSGRPPSALNALLRATVGVFGVVTAFAGVVPVLLGRTSLHDRLAGTRVVRA